MNIEIKSYVTLLLFGGSLILFFVLNFFTDFAFDDFNYAFKYTAQGLSSVRLHSLTDIFSSQYYHYFWQNGRVVVHFLIQLFRMSDSKIWFDICNTVVFGLFQIGVFRLIKNDLRKIKPIHYLLFLLIGWFLLPGPNHALLWLSGSVNYLWASTSAIYLLILNNRISRVRDRKTGLIITVFFLSFLMNATHEVIAIPLSVTLLYSLISDRNKGVASWSIFGGASLGALFIALAPANFRRLSEATSGGGNVGDTLSAVDNYRFLSVKIFIILAIVIIIWSWINRTDIVAKFKTIIPYLIFVAVSLSLVVVSHSISQRAMFPAAVFAMVVLMVILFSSGGWPKKNIYSYFVVGFTICALFEYGHVLHDLRQNQIASLKQRVEMEESKPEVTLFPSVVYCRNRFVSTGLGNQSPEYYVNQGLSRIYQKPMLAFLPASYFQYLNRFSKDSIHYIRDYRWITIPLRTYAETEKIRGARVILDTGLANSSNAKKYYPFAGVATSGAFLMFYVKSDFSFRTLKSISVINRDNQLIHKYKFK